MREIIYRGDEISVCFSFVEVFINTLVYFVPFYIISPFIQIMSQLLIKLIN